MMTKPPGFASSSTLPLEDDEEESIDESLDEILLEANEKPQENSAKSLEAVPSSLDESEIDEDSDVIDAMSASSTGRGAAPPSEITVIAPRPTFADEEVKEETKVDPYETAIRAAASREVGLTSQASHQRERALRKSITTPVRVPGRPALAEAEFEDAETGNEDAYDSAPHGEHSERTPADIPVAEDSVPSPAGGYATAGGFMPRLPPPGRPMPPPGRPDIYPGRRIPTPSSDFLPPPAGGGFGSGAHYPSIAIPAPSAYDGSARTATARGETRVRLPPAGLAMFLVTAFGGGLLVGALLWRGQTPSAPVDLPVVTHAVSKPIVAEPVQPIVKPVPAAAPAAAAPTAVAAPTTAAPAGEHPATAPAAAVPTLAAEAVPAVTDTPPPAPVVEKPKKKIKKTTTLDEDLAAAAEETAPPPPRARKKKSTPWQDPFAQ